ncbi:MazG family protein [uncultured Rothia sp.]|uniref:MazG family protein n=1 Tax=uncultured Rothia sp. TaxID=316088 RepID=UPI0028DCA8DC|nr:MazG family protein [uncultured Rothia sp.]
MTDTPITPDLPATRSSEDTARRAGEAFETLVETMARLRAPGGCPWDAEQTHASLIRYLVEEAYEVVEAVETGAEPNMPLLREELGDVLLQVVFHSDIAAANPHGFDIVQVIEGLVQKLRSRHPDVFAAESEGSSEAPRTAAEQQAAWDALKKKEKSDRGALDGIPPHLPALAMAEKTAVKARKAGIILPPEPTSMDDDLRYMHTEEDFGELLFALVCRAQRNGLDAERALRSYIRRYVAQHTNDEPRY